MKILTFWLPAVCLVGAIINAFVAVPYFYEEVGVVENLTVGFLLATLVMLLMYAFGNFRSMEPMDKALLVVMVLGSIYFAGEELSWGQHLFHLKTSASYAAINHQKEMNLHNLNGIYRDLFDKIPRTILTIGILFGGIIFPFCREKLPLLIRRYVPGKDVLFVSLLVVLITLPEKLFHFGKHAHHVKGQEEVPNKAIQVGFDGGELKEMYIALFILLFAIYFLRYVKARRIERSLIA